MVTQVQESEAADNSFSRRTANMASIKNMRYSLGSGRIRIVLDMTKETDFKVSYAEEPSRIVIDIYNTWLAENVPQEVDLSAQTTAMSKIRMAQNNPSTVRVVIETMAENVVFFLNGGPAGKRLVIDLGLGAEQPGFDKKVSSEMTTPSADNSNSDSRSNNGVLRPDERDNRSSGNNNNNNDNNNNNNNNNGNTNNNNDNNTNNNSTHRTIDVNRTPGIAGKKIVIDPGHGGNDAGAIGPSGVMEKSVTLRVALELKQLLEAEGATVIMTRETDTEVAERGRHATDIEELKARCDVANNAEADMFISIHADSFTNPAARGTTGYYFGRGTDDSKKLADCIRKALCEALNTPSRGTQPCNFYVVRNTDMPATLIELAFISNPTEEKLLNSDEGVTKAAQAIFNGIKEYCG